MGGGARRKGAAERKDAGKKGAGGKAGADAAGRAGTGQGDAGRRAGTGAAGKKDAGPRDAGKKGARRRASCTLEDAIRAGTRRRYHQAVPMLEELLSDPGAEPEVYLYLGRALHALGEYPRALAALSDYTRLRPGNFQGYLFSGRTFLALGQYGRAAASLDRALALSPRNTHVMALLGAAFLKSRRPARAAAVLEQAVRIAAARNLPPNEQGRIYRAYCNALLVRGIRLVRQEEYGAGLEMLRFVLENGQDLPLLRLEMGRACRELGKAEEALEHYSRALDFAPGDRRIRWARASMLMILGRPREARDEIEEIRRGDPGLPDLPWNSETVDLYLVRLYLEDGEWRRAAEACKILLRKKPGGFVHALYAEALRNLGDFRSALNHLDLARKFEGDRLEYQYERLLCAWEGEDWKALGGAITRLKILGGDPDLIYRFEVLYRAKREPDDKEIIGLLQGAIRRAGPDPDLMYCLGERYLRSGLADLALGWFRKARSLREDDEQAWLGEIAALGALESPAPAGPGPAAPNPAAAAPNPAAATPGPAAATPGPAAAAPNPAAAPADRYGRELEEGFDQFLRRWPDNHRLRRERALFLVRRRRFDSAAGDLELLLAREPDNPSLRRVLAYSYRKLGRYREAAVFLKQLLRERPGDIRLLLEYSHCLERAGAPAYAIFLLEQTLPLFPRSPDLPICLALIYFREGKNGKAREYLREAADRAPGDSRPRQWLAAVAAKQGDREQEEYWNREAAKRRPPR